MAEAKQRPLDGESKGPHDRSSYPKGSVLSCQTATRKDALHWAAKPISWGEVCDAAQRPAHQKACGNWFFGTLRETTTTHKGTSVPCRRIHRTIDGVVSRSVLTLDADKDAAGLPDLVELLLPPCAAVVHSTFSHTADEPRYRVLLPLDREVDADEYQRVGRVVLHMLGGADRFDPASLNPAQYMFKPSASDPSVYEFRVLDGPALAVDALLDRYDPTVHGVPDRGSQEDGKQSPFEVPGVVGAFNRAYSIEEAIETFALPYESAGADRWSLVGAHSKAGLHLVDDGLVYSFHANNDPAYGRTCSAFDLVRLHRFGAEDADAPAGTPIAKHPSHAAMAKLAMRDDRVVAELGRVSAADDFGDDQPEDANDKPLPVALSNADAWAREAVGRARLSDVFRRGTDLVSVAREGEDGYVPPKDDEDDNGPSQVVRLSTDALLARMVYRHTFFNLQGKPTNLPRSAAALPVAAPDLLPNVRDLAGVTDFPLVRPDGSLLATPGYDPASRVYYLPRGEAPTVPDRPTGEDVRRARAALEYVAQDFPFRTEDDRANYLGMLLTPAMRLVAPGRSKGCILDAPDAGSGKTLLAKVLLELYGGVMRSSWPHDEAEVGKEIATIFDTTSAPVVVFDNVRGTLRSAQVEALLTGNVFSGRRLGSNTQIVAPNDRLWVWTANNLTIGGDMARRVLRVSIDANMPKPHMRPAEAFAEPDLRGYVRDHRGDLLGAVLTLVRAWVLAGRPTTSDAADEFSEWRASVAGVLHHAGIPGEFDSMATRLETDSDEDDEWGQFLEAVYEKVGSKPWKAGADFLRYLPEEAWPGDLVVKRLSDGLAKSLGWWLRNRKDRWAGDLCVRRVPNTKEQDRKNGAEWFLERRANNNVTEGVRK